MAPVRSTATRGGPTQSVRDLLGEAARNAVDAAVALVSLADGGDTESAERIRRLEAEGDRITHDLLRTLRQLRVAGADRAALVEVTRAIDDCVDAIDDAAHALRGCDCGGSVGPLSAVVRDVARAEARLIADFRPSAAGRGQPLVDLAHELAEEADRISRAAVARIVGSDNDPVTAVRQKSCVEQVGAALEAGVHAVQATDRATMAL